MGSSTTPSPQKHALILDDEPMILALLQNILGRRGYKVEAYTTPARCPIYFEETCPCAIQASCPNVILTDLDMPLATGLEFIERLKKKGCKCRHIALISGLLTETALQRAVPLGVKVFTKPFHIKGIEEWLVEAEQDFA